MATIGGPHPLEFAVFPLVIWAAIYWRTWGAANFLHLSDVAVILTCIGLWSNSALLISSQAVASLAVDTVWTLDVAWKICSGRHVIGSVAIFGTIFAARLSLPSAVTARG